MSRLSSRVTALETGQGVDTGLEQLRAVSEVRANLIKRGIHDHANGNANAFEDIGRHLTSYPDIALSKAQRDSIAEDAAEFMRRIETMRRNMQ